MLQNALLSGNPSKLKAQPAVAVVRRQWEQSAAVFSKAPRVQAWATGCIESARRDLFSEFSFCHNCISDMEQTLTHMLERDENQYVSVL